MMRRILQRAKMKYKAFISLCLIGAALAIVRAEDVEMKAEKAMVITFPSQTQRTYKLLAAPNASGTWATLKDGIVGTGGEVTIFYKSESDQKLFFKVETSDGPPGQRSLLSLANLDISGENLSGYDLEGADLRGFKFEGTQFDGANLVAANISEGIFDSADFTGADLSHVVAANVKMEGASFSAANLDGVRFVGGSLRRADFRNANMKGVQFDGVDISEANLAGVTLTNLSFRSVTGGELDQIDFRGANLAGADLSRHSASFTKFDSANLTGVNFEGVSFQNVSMKNRDLRSIFLRGIVVYFGDWSGINGAGVDLSLSELGRSIFLADANLAGANLEGAIFASNYGFPGPWAGGFTNINFRGANLKGAFLQVLSFQNCDFTGADLSFADVAGSTFQGCLGLDTEQPGMNFYNTTLDGTVRTGKNPGDGEAPAIIPPKLQLSREGYPVVTIELEPPKQRTAPLGPISEFRISGEALIGEYTWTSRGRVGTLRLAAPEFGNYKLLFTSATGGQLFSAGHVDSSRVGTFLIGTFTVPQ
jgi:uncharacterized protein YjbI with pentapeptide repeats